MVMVRFLYKLKRLCKREFALKNKPSQDMPCVIICQFHKSVLHQKIKSCDIHGTTFAVAQGSPPKGVLRFIFIFLNCKKQFEGAVFHKTGTSRREAKPTEENPVKSTVFCIRPWSFKKVPLIFIVFYYGLALFHIFFLWVIVHSVGRSPLRTFLAFISNPCIIHSVNS